MSPLIFIKTQEARVLINNKKYIEAQKILNDLPHSRAKNTLNYLEESLAADMKLVYNLIKQKELPEARERLKTIGHPKANQLLTKLDIDQINKHIAKQEYDQAKKIVQLHSDDIEFIKIGITITIAEAKYLLSKKQYDQAKEILEPIDHPEAKKLLTEIGRIKAGTKDFQIGIWGATNSGKTTYLAMLYDALEQHRDWRVFTDEEGRNFITEHIKTIRSNKHFPPSTEPSAEEPKKFHYHVHRMRTGNNYNQINIKFIDAPGEYYENPYAPGLNILDYLSECHGVIFLLDPEPPSAEKSDYHNMVLDLLREFHKRATYNTGVSQPHLEQYLAFATTKIDRKKYWLQCATSEASPELDPKKTQAFVINVMAQSTYNALVNNYTQEGRHKLFALSAVGRSQDKDTGEWRENVTYPDELTDGTTIRQGYNPAYRPSQSSTTEDAHASNVLPLSDNSPDPEDSQQADPIINNLNPINVIEPLEWLIDSMFENPPQIETGEKV